MDARKSTIKDFLSISNTYFVIPVYQRNFCWEMSQCRKLFDDLLHCITTRKTHFLGTICYKAEELNTNVIIDGQQRITCISLLLKALYDASFDGSLRTKIQNQYLLNPLDDGTMKLKLKPIQRDAGVYKRLLSHYKVDSDAFTSKEMNTPLYNAFCNFRVWIQELKEIDDYENKLMQAIESLEIVEIIVTSENPQEIFESLNATGMSLTNTDILRNYLLMTAPYKEQVRLYKTYWLPMEESVTTEEIQNFVCSYLVTKRLSDEININGKRWKINPGNICLAFREEYSNMCNSDELEELFEDMYKYSQYYKHIVFEKGTNPASLTDLGARLYELFETLKDSRFKPLVLYLFERLSNGIITNDEMVQMLKIMISYVFRNHVCGARGFTANYQFSAFVMRKLQDIQDGDDYVKNFKKIISSGHGAYAFPSDLMFEHALLHTPITLNAQKIKYLLYSIEKELNPYQKAAMTAGTIEHIMPQTLSDSWAKYLAFNGSADMHEEKLNALGNLTISESNGLLSNKLFNDKKDIYADSEYKITKDLKNISVWNRMAIDNRSKELFEIALKIWPSAEFSTSTEDDFIKYTLESDLVKVTSTPPASFSFLGEEVPVNSWQGIGCGVVSILYSLDPKIIESLLHECPSEIEGMISKEADFKKQPSKIADGLWLNQVKRSSSLMKQLKILLQVCSNKDHSLCDELWFTLIKSNDDDDIIVMI